MSPDTRDPGDDNLDRLLTMSDAPPRLDPDARTRLLARLQASVDAGRAHADAPASPPKDPLPMPPRRNRPRTLAAATLALAASGALVWGGARLLRGGPSGHVPGDSLTVHRNDGGRPQTVALADGSTAILRAGAELRELGARRLELVAGEVLLDVRPGAGAFTVVAAASGEVEVRGTKFLLRRAADTGEVFAGVLRGEVRLRGGAGETTLLAGESGVLSPKTAPARRPAPRLSHEVAWARDALADPTDDLKAVRRGNLLARFPNWPGEFPLDVRTMDVDVVVENGVARTTIDQTFFNQTLFELEGVYSFPLPADAAIARMAMYVDGQRMEAGITERQEGREIYESIVYRRRDPALLEWMQGNEFRVRIFPLPARTEKRILLSYTQPLASLYGDYAVRVPIPELDRPVGTLRYRVHVKDPGLAIDSCCVPFTITDAKDERLAEAVMHDVPLGEDLALTLYPKQAPAPATLAVQPDPGGDYLMVRARPTLPQSSEHTARRWVVLHDTSASRSPAELAAQTRFLRALLRELDESDRVTVLAFDSTIRALPGGFTRVDALDPAAVDAFLAGAAREHIGGTALGRALDSALGLLADDAGPEAPHILYVGDGLTEGRSDLARAGLRERLAGKATFVAAAIGDEVDLDLLGDLAAATGGLRVQIAAGADLGWQALDLAAALNTARLQDLRATLLGPGDVPLSGRTHRSADSLADGEALVVLSRRTGPEGPDPTAILLEGRLAGAPWSQRLDLPPAARGARYVPRLWARAQIAADVRAGAEANKDEITALGLEHFLVTPFTSLLVLENEAMYQRFKVRRPPEDDWARYPAPDTIDVVREPFGAVEPAPGQIVQRRPLQLLGDPGYAYRGLGLTTGPLPDVLGGLGLTGFGRGGGGTGEALIGLGLLGKIGSKADAADRASAHTSVVTKESTTEPRFVTAADLRNDGGWERDTVTAPTTASRRSRGDGRFAPGFGGELQQQSLAGPMIPMALHYLGDVRLGDLGEHLPALFEDDVDRERERLIAASAGVPAGKITPAARELLTAARAAAGVDQLRVDGGVLRIDADGRFVRARTIGGYLRESVVYDGDTLTAVYPDLDLAVVRRVGLVEPALLAQWAPWRLPAPDALARWYDVDLDGERALKLTIPGTDDVVRLELDDQRRLVGVRRHRGRDLVAELRVERDAGGITLVHDGRRTRLGRTDAAPESVDPAAVQTVLDLPLRGDADLERDLAAAAPADWRRLQRQRLAVLAALGQYPRAAEVLGQIHARGPVTRGELVLGGAGLVQAEGGLAGPVLADRPRDPVAQYLAGLRQARRSGTGLLDQVAKDSRGTLPGLLASHARVLADVPRGPGPAPLARFQDLLAYDHPELARIAASQLAGTYWRRPGDAARLWDALAEAKPRWRAFALHAAGTALWYAGKYADASDHFERSLVAAIDTGETPPIDWTVRAAIQQSSGQAGWRLQWNRWRDAVHRSGDAGRLVGFLAAARMLGETGEVHRVLAGLDFARVDLDQGLALARLVLDAGQPADAQRILRGLLARAPDDPALLDLAAAIAQREGRLTEAAELAERALAGETELPLTRLRAAYGAIFDLRARLAQSLAEPDGAVPGDSSAAPARHPLDLALDVAARWRAEDPDNPEIDERCAALLFALGHVDEALRHLDSIAERHPAEGAAHARVAEALEREGRIDDADRRWQQAIDVEPTNPTWLVRRAHNLLAAGDPAGARDLARRVVGGKWQDRFNAAVQDARDLARLLDRRGPAKP